jgi:hypothetical protein
VATETVGMFEKQAKNRRFQTEIQPSLLSEMANNQTKKARIINFIITIKKSKIKSFLGF